MQSTRRTCLLTALAIAVAPALAQQKPSCHIDPFQGATLPNGTVARMTVANTGSTCSITNYGVPGERRNPADSGSITSRPLHGVAEFVAPQAKYSPEPGFVGEDEFTYEAFAKGNINQQLRLKVQVKVKVIAPQ